MSEIRTNLLKSERGDASPSAPFGLRITGVCTATTFKGNLTGAATELATNATGANLTLSGNLGVAGTLTYEDVTRVDAVGLSTFREGFGVGPLAGIAATVYKDGSIRSTGIITATTVSVGGSITAGNKFYGDGSQLTGISAGAGGATALSLNDGVKANFGTDDDLRIYGGSGNSFIQHQDTAAGDLYIDAEASNVYIRSGDGGTSEENAIVCENNGKVKLYHSGTHVAETSANGLAFPSGKGIDFSAVGGDQSNMSGELLDDYEEGYYVPTCTNSVTLDAYGNRLWYTKIGNQVTVSGSLKVSSSNSGQQTELSLPYTAAGGGRGSSSHIGSFNPNDWSTEPNYWGNDHHAWCEATGTTIKMRVRQDNGDWHYFYTSDNMYLGINITYTTAS